MLWGVCCFAAALLVTSAEELANSSNGCQRAGVQADPNDCQSFVICDWRNNAPVFNSRRKCPAGYAFSTEENTCMPAKEVPSCPSVSVPTRRRRQTAAQCQTPGVYCETCNRLVMCSGPKDNGIVIFNQTCSATSPDLVCLNDTAACGTPKAGDVCVLQTSPTFRCLMEGTFPDPTDCKRYQVCMADGDKFRTATDTCPSSYKLSDQTCDSATCTTNQAMACSATNAAPKAFDADKSYVRICIPVQGKNAITYDYSVVKCSGPMQQFNDATKRCEEVCSSVGRLPVSGDCRSYMECTEVGKPPTRKSCPSGLAFNGTTKMCVAETQVTTCSLTTTTATSSTTPSPVTQSTTSVTPAPQSRPPTSCPAAGFYPDPSNNCRYYWCRAAGWLPMVRGCPPYQMFDGCRQACTWTLFPSC